MLKSYLSVIGGAIAVIITLIIVNAFWTDRTLDCWLSYYRGTPVDVPWYLSAALTVVTGGTIMLVNIISEILRLVV